MSSDDQFFLATAGLKIMNNRFQQMIQKMNKINWILKINKKGVNLFSKWKERNSKKIYKRKELSKKA